LHDYFTASLIFHAAMQRKRSRLQVRNRPHVSVCGLDSHTTVAEHASIQPAFLPGRVEAQTDRNQVGRQGDFHLTPVGFPGSLRSRSDAIVHPSRSWLDQNGMSRDLLS
jgi:hypothetical protein